MAGGYVPEVDASLFAMWNLMLLAALSAGPLDVSAVTLDGRTATGALIGLSTQGVSVSTAAGQTQFELKMLKTVRPLNLSFATPAETTLTLRAADLFGSFAPQKNEPIRTLTGVTRDSEAGGVVESQGSVSYAPATGYRGTLQYTPKAGFRGVDRFTFTLSTAGQGVQQVPVTVLVTEQPTAWVTLVDGSYLAASDYRVARGTASIGLSDSAPTEVTTRLIHSVRLQRPDPRLETAWKEISGNEAKGDLLIVRKRNAPAADGTPPATEFYLDFLEGLVYDVTPDTVVFEYEGERINVRREKVEGIVYFHPSPPPLSDPVCRVRDALGNNWNAKSLELDGDRMSLVTGAGVNYSLPVSGLRNLDFGSGNVVYLSDLDPEEVQWASYLDSRRTTSRTARLFAMRKDASFDGGPLELRGQTYSKGLAVHSRTLVTYRLPENFRHLTGLAGIDDASRTSGNVRLQILGDSAVLLERDIDGEDEPLAIDLDVTGVRRLKILVDFGENGDVGDHLNLCDLRITK